MQAGVRAWVLRTARGGGRGLRESSPPVLSSLLCAAAFSPLIAASAGVSGAGTAVVAGIGVASSVGSGLLSGVIANALARLRSHGERRESSAGPGEEVAGEVLEAEVAQEIRRMLAAGDATSAALRAEIAAMLAEIDAGGTMLRAAIETGSEQVRSEVIAAIGVLGIGFAELGFLITDVARTATQIQESLDEQSANVRAIVDQNTRQSTEIRLARQDLAVVERRTRLGGRGEMEAAASGPRWVHGCPYRGLLPFGEADAEVFYGRERLTTELAVSMARRVSSGGLVVVTGASGAGKSSLLRAGLLPALAQGLLVQGSEHWPQMVITPTRDPLTELATHLAVLGGADTVAIRDGLVQHPVLAHLAFRQAAAADAARRSQGPLSADRAARLVLIVDQFEQIFTLSPGSHRETERQAFIAALHAAATSPVGPDDGPPALVVIVVRGDFWDRCAAYPELADALQDGPFVVGPMTDSDLRLAITGPADAAGLRIEDSLTDTVVGDLRETPGNDAVGTLPLLSQAMLLTWENRDGNLLTGHGYGQAGGVNLAVQTSADAVFDSFTADQQKLAQRLLRHMTVVGRDGRLTRRPVDRTELYSGLGDSEASQGDAILEAFAARRLVVLNDGTLQLAHDAILVAWPRLRGWLEDDQINWILHGQLGDDTASWHDHNEDASFLYRGTQLATVQKAASHWAANPSRYPAVTSAQRDFLHASENAAARSTRQRRMVAAALVVLLIVSLALAGLAARTAGRADQQRAAAVQRRNVAVSAQLAAQGERLDTTDPARAALLAAASWRIAHTPQATESMLDVLAQPQRSVLTAVGDFPYTTVAFSPDGKILAIGDQNGTARLRDLTTHRQIGEAMSESNGQVLNALTFSPNGKLLAIADADGLVRLWNVATQRQIGTTIRGRHDIASVAFSPDGRLLATADGDGTVRLWNLITHHQVGAPMIATSGERIKGTTFTLATSVAFSPDGRVLATAGLGGPVRLWDVGTHDQIGASFPHSSRGVGAEEVAFSPDGEFLATGDADGTARLWDVARHQQVGIPMSASGREKIDGVTSRTVTSLAFSPGGKVLATAGVDGTLRLWDVATQGQIGVPMIASTASGIDGNTIDVAFSPGGRALATAGGGDGTVRLWDADIYRQSGEPITPGGGVTDAAFNPDGQILATADGDGTARLWNLPARTQSGVPMAASSRRATDKYAFSFGVYTVEFSPGGRVLATVGSDLTARLWDVATHRQVGAPITASRSGVYAAAFSPDGKTLATAGPDSSAAEMWDVLTHRPVGPPMNPSDTSTVSGSSSAVAFNPRGTILATGDITGTARLWDVATGRQIGAAMTATSSTDLGVNVVAFSPDGKILATAGDDGTVRLWNVMTQREIGAPMNASSNALRARVRGLAFSHNGQILATASSDGTVRLWDVDTEGQIGAPMIADQGASAVAFSPNDQMLAIADGAGTVLFMNVAFPANLSNAMCSIPPVTRQEWQSAIPSETYQKICGL